MPTSSFTAAQDFKAAFLTAIRSCVDLTGVLVTFGHPGDQSVGWADMIALGSVRSEQTPGPIGTQRSRDEVLALAVHISATREQEVDASAAAYGYLEAIEHQVRVTDTNVGNTVLWCFLTAHESDGFTTNDLMPNGRTIEIEATFTARVRITGA